MIEILVKMMNEILVKMIIIDNTSCKKFEYYHKFIFVVHIFRTVLFNSFSADPFYTFLQVYNPKRKR